MTELAATDGMSPPSNLPRGECIIHRVKDSIWVAQADPRIIISGELLDAIVDDPTPAAWLDTAGCTTYDGALLKIHGVNRTVIYRIMCYVARIHAYIAEWPDLPWPHGDLRLGLVRRAIRRMAALAWHMAASVCWPSPC